MNRTPPHRVDVRRRGSVTGPADELVVTQPSVSAAVSALERELALQPQGAVELELGLLGTISPRGGLPERRWHVVRSAVGPVR
jgi:hypothetical protein